MASSGSLNTTAYNASDGTRFLTLSWTEQVQSITNNTTTISWRLTGAGTSSQWIYSGNFKVVIDNKTVYSSATRIKLENGTLVASGTATMTHDSAGKRSFSASVQAGIYTNAVNCTGSGTFTLDDIPRKSSLSVGNGTLGTALAFTITEKASAFNHKVFYHCGSVGPVYILGSASATSSTLSFNWTPPLSLASQNTTGSNLTIKYTLQTYSGSTLIGSTVYTKSLTIPLSTVVPTLSVTLEDVTGVDEIYGSPVQGLSKIQVLTTATPAYGSPISSCVVTLDGNTYTGYDVTSDTLSTSGSSRVMVTARDKRGAKVSWVYFMNVQEYTQPSIPLLTVHRCDEDGTENDQGGYIRVGFSAAVTSLGSKNTATYTLRYKTSTATSYTTMALSELENMYATGYREYIFQADGNESYIVEVEAKDAHHTTTRSTAASTAFTLMNWGDNGTSFAVGKVAERDDAFEVALDSYLLGSTIQTGNRYSFSSPGTANSGGYVRMARITITAANADTPITFVLTQRQQPTTMTVYVTLTNADLSASSVNKVVYEGSNYGAYIAKIDELTYELYVLKGSNWDTITIQDWYTSKTMESRIDVTFPGDLVSTVPTPYYRATPAQMESLLDYIYPVDSIYISYSHKDPATMFGGTWVRITNAFLWACDASGQIGRTGGESEHTLTVAELPSHSHGSVYSGNVSGTKTHAWLASGGSSMAYGTVATGSGAAHNNMPPYIQVSVWRRTA